MVLLVLLLLEGFLLMDRAELETLILRTPGTLYYEKSPGTISNLYNYKLVNKLDSESQVEFKVVDVEAEIEYIGKSPHTTRMGSSGGSMFITMDEDKLKERKTNILLDVYMDGQLKNRVKTSFYGPKK
jgi:hypothetical protein